MPVISLQQFVCLPVCFLFSPPQNEKFLFLLQPEMQPFCFHALVIEGLHYCCYSLFPHIKSVINALLLEC